MSVEVDALLQHIRDLESDLDAAREALRKQLEDDNSVAALEALLLMEGERYRRAKVARETAERNVVKLTERATTPPRRLTKARIQEITGIQEFVLYDWLRKAKGNPRRKTAA